MLSTRVNASDIREFSLFKGLSPSQLEKIGGLCQRQSIAANTVIFDPSSRDENVYFVEEGHDSIQIEIPIPGYSSKIVIHTLNKGEVFGWAPLGPPHAKTALARCVESSTLVSLKGRDLMALLETDTAMGYRVMKNLSEIISSRLAYTSVVFRREINRLIKKNNEDLSL
jgi:CRP-like cAMP-binding protein